MTARPSSAVDLYGIVVFCALALAVIEAGADPRWVIAIALPVAWLAGARIEHRRHG